MSPLDSPLNRALTFGFGPAWDQARECDKRAVTSLHDLVGSDAVCLVHRRNEKSTKFVPIVHTVDRSNTYTAWRWIDCDSQWKEMDTWEYSVDTRMACLAAMNNKRQNLEEEMHIVKQELSSVRLDYEILRHEYERVRPVSKPVATRRINWSWLCFGFLALICLLPGSDARVQLTKDPFGRFDWRVVDDDYVSWYDKINIWDTRIAGYINDTAQYCAHYVKGITVTSVMNIVTSYRFTALVLGALSMIKSGKPTLTLAMLILGYLTRYKYVALATSAYMSMTATFTFVCVMLLDLISPMVSLYVAVAQLGVFAILGLSLDDVGYMTLLRGHFSVVVAACVSTCVRMFGVPDLAVVAVMVSWRVCSVLPLMGPKVEVKDGNGNGR